MIAVLETLIPARGPGCPDHDTLERFLAGRLADAEAEPVEQHLKGCPSCLDRLEGMVPHDRLVDDVRGWGAGPGAADEPETVTSLIQRLRQPAATGTADPGQAAGPSTPGGLDTPADIPPPADGGRQPPSGPAQLGRYRVLRPLGAGGMGAVYLADDPELGRPVAVKVPQFAGPPEAQVTARQRFLREARAAAAVRHPHVCPIYDVGEHAGTPYVVMAFIEGRSLAERLKSEGHFADPRAAAALALQVAEGLVAVHERGLIHRDLKPANVLLDVAGDAFLTDFGLARRQDEADRLTASGALIGTLAYMAPEQADPAGGFGPVTPRTDVYSLGVVLYEMLTGHRPFKAESPTGLLYQIVHATPPPPRQLRPDLDPELEAICLKAIAKKAEDRYTAMTELAQALAGYLQAPAPPAEPPPSTVPDEGWRPARPQRRRPRMLWVAAAAGALAVVLLMGVVLYVVTHKGTIRIEIDDHDAVVRVDGEVLGIDKLGEPMTLWVGEHHLVVTRGDAVVEVRTFTVKRGDNEVLKITLLPRRPDEKTRVEPPPAPKPPDREKPGEQLPAPQPPAGLPPAVHALLQTLTNEDASVRRTAAAKLASHKHPAVGAALGQALSDTDARVRREAAHSLRKLADPAAVPDLVKRVADEVWGKVAPRLRMVSDPAIYEDVAEGKNQGSKYAALEALKELAPDKVPEALLAATKATNAAVREWAARELGKLPPRKDEGEKPEPARPEGQSPRSPRPGVPVLKGHTNTVLAVAFSPDGKLLATAGEDKSIRLWDVATGERKDRIAHKVAVHCLAFSPDGQTLASGGADKAVTLWDVATGEQKRTLAGVSTAPVVWVGFAPNGRTLATVGLERTVVGLWDVVTGKEVRSLEGHKDYVNAAAFSPDSQTVATVSDDATVRLWDAASGAEKGTLTAHDGAVYCLAFSPDGKRLATGGRDRTIFVWDVHAGKVIRPVLEAPKWGVDFVGWTSDGRLVSHNYGDGVRLWNPSVTKPVVIGKDFASPLNAIKLSAWSCGARVSVGVGKEAASCHDDGS